MSRRLTRDAAKQSRAISPLIEPQLRSALASSAALNRFTANLKHFVQDDVLLCTGTMQLAPKNRPARLNEVPKANRYLFLRQPAERARTS